MHQRLGHVTREGDCMEPDNGCCSRRNLTKLLLDFSELLLELWGKPLPRRERRAPGWSSHDCCQTHRPLLRDQIAALNAEYANLKERQLSSADFEMNKLNASGLTHNDAGRGLPLAKTRCELMACPLGYAAELRSIPISLNYCLYLKLLRNCWYNNKPEITTDNAKTVHKWQTSLDSRYRLS